MNNAKASRIRGWHPLAAIACTLVAAAASAGEPFYLETHWRRVPGVQDIESGNYERGVATIEARLNGRRMAPSIRVPMLINLCVGYAMLNRLEDAARACDDALETGWYRGLARNNRGVVNMVRGRHAMAIEDFRKAARSEVSYRTARMNLRQAAERVAAIERQREQTRFAAVTDIVDVSTAAIERP